METTTIAFRDVVAARPRAPKAAYLLLAPTPPTPVASGGEVCPMGVGLTGSALLADRTAVRTDVFVPAPGSSPGGHPA